LSFVAVVVVIIIIIITVFFKMPHTKSAAKLTQEIGQIIAPDSESEIVFVNNQLVKLQELVDENVLRIFRKEVTFTNALEKKNYISKWNEELFANEYGLITELLFFGRATIPTFTLVAARQRHNDTRYPGTDAWHVVVVGRFGSVGYLYDPNYDENYAKSLSKLDFSTKARAVFENLGLKPMKQSSSSRKTQVKPVTLFVGGGGNNEGECRKMCFDFLKRLVITALINPPLSINNIFGDDNYHQINW
jgi:hypothetical protein